MPLAGAGSTSGAVFGSGSGGKGMCGPRGGRWAGVVFLVVMGEGPPASLFGLGAIAEVERIFRGLRASGFAGGAEGGAGVLETGGESGLSGLGVLPPRDGGRLEEDLGDSESFWDNDCER